MRLPAASGSGTGSPAVVEVRCAIDLLDKGRIISAMTPIPMQWFRAHHEALRERMLGAGLPDPVIPRNQQSVLW